MTELNNADIIQIVLMLVLLIVGVVSLARRGKSLDDAVSQKFAEMADREQMDRLERAYAAAGQNQRQALEMAEKRLSILAPLTPMKADDAAVSLLRDIEQSGAPEAAK